MTWTITKTDAYTKHSQVPNTYVNKYVLESIKIYKILIEEIKKKYLL
jgi:hypothetical protein